MRVVIRVGGKVRVDLALHLLHVDLDLGRAPTAPAGLWANGSALTERAEFGFSTAWPPLEDRASTDVPDRDGRG